MADEAQSSFMDTGISPTVLTIKHQNCTVSLDSSKYPDPLPILIECLKASSLNKALTCFENVSISSLTKAYTTSKYNSVKNTVVFELENGNKTSISQKTFIKILNLPVTENLVDPDLIPNPDMIRTFNQMGHSPILTRISGFKKNKLPTMWSCLFTILFKCLAERQTGTDSENK